MKTCNICGEIYKPTGRNQRYCQDCKSESSRQATQRYRLRRAIENGTTHRVGIGKGGGQKKGKGSPSYKSGIKYFHEVAPKIKEQRRFCERCDKDLKDANRYQWCLHHKDHDRTNNEDENFELLCKRCHQIEHKCWEAFESATTSRKT